MEVNGQLDGCTSLVPAKSPRYPLNRRLGQLEGQYGHIRDLLPLQGLEFLIIRP